MAKKSATKKPASKSAKPPKDLSPKGGVKGGKQKSWNPANF
jgi:hypothetical protein